MKQIIVKSNRPRSQDKGYKGKVDRQQVVLELEKRRAARIEELTRRAQAGEDLWK